MSFPVWENISLSQWSSQIHKVTVLLNDKTSFVQNNEQKPQAKAKQSLSRNWEAEMTHSPRLQPHSDLSTKNMLHRHLSSRSSLVCSHFYFQTSILVFKRPIRLRHSCQESKGKKNMYVPGRTENGCVGISIIGVKYRLIPWGECIKYAGSNTLSSVHRTQIIFTTRMVSGECESLLILYVCALFVLESQSLRHFRRRRDSVLDTVCVPEVTQLMYNTVQTF